MTRAKSSDRNVIRLGAWRIGDEALVKSEISGHTPCGKADTLPGARTDISFGTFRSSSRRTSIKQRHRISVAPREMSERVGNFTPPRNVREFSQLLNLIGAREALR
jgi:hypothetical protein